jgi:catechol 2,3-dioxygenase-like lactoylglutathione lyase family enzyme
MFDHVGVVFRDLKGAGDFYRVVLAPLGVRVMEDHTQPDGTGWLVFSTGAPESPFFVVAAGRPSYWGAAHGPALSPAHLAFVAPSRAAVDAFHSAGLAAGGLDNGGPGVRRGRYYCAFLIDPDGNNLEAGVYA